MSVWFLFPLAVFLSALLTGGIRRYAISRSLIDVPNSRSSHSVPTPRGGGVAIVLIFLLFVPIFGMTGCLEWPAICCILGTGAGVAALGFLDDHGHIAARWRLLGHFLCAAWALYWLGGLPPLEFWGGVIDLQWFGVILSAFYLVWLLNLYNFMDGIDGLASVEAICTCVGVCIVYWLTGFTVLIGPPLLLAMAVSGFLIWNFPPARIFMGDAGSGFLGVMLGVLSLYAAWKAPFFLWVWLVLLGVFVVDATFTLFSRLLQGRRVYEAHRSHAYQHAARKVGSHLPVTGVVAAINVFWLFPIAICISVLGLNGLLGVAIAYLPLIVLAYKYRAGTDG
ncbi:MraY family glycosyltransferase [Pseudomonas lurida]|jgi:Fuc2NAc and GlcNAc transferase|uniref:Undecaprenyl-phosphate alpha-N-acetylglucosaminyl 1-phosphate transferase n=2 Tax=Pseudomonas TaxID=286 RepID=A0A5E6MRP6_PSEFL|nr:glycosyltransferase family 4 protein [Pseudomonas lurida]VVM11853.1 Undecaprenyl-phosphate alpha-N-acetylglucosaminyl 1-phosphate transferase [Pseudomonas fluorescens]MBC8982174.1 glycosyltransferase family 4 protein [Pseudomonas lurida]MCF5025840.1 glycosyl transferase [Pseudomonas lurida]MCF5311225.1 glycosyl transferase [Pseudomonas lurida]WLH08884.1 glycosyltransferase family 4 protein [Pseudomonas lurida]